MIRLASLTLGLWTAAFAARPLTPPAPEFPAEALWLNSKPLTLKALRDRKAVLVAFLNSANINSLRALGTLKAWSARYSAHGLLTVAVHTPDYDFQKDHRATHAAITRLGLDMPVLVDSERKLWKAYENEGWPAFYLIDHRGRILFDRLGEGGYRELEGEIRSALENIPGYGAPKVDDLVSDPPSADCGPMTREVQAGSAQGKPIKLHEDEIRLAYLFSVRDGEVGYYGAWSPAPDALRLLEDNAKRDAFVSVIYRGARAYGVVGARKLPARVYLRQDELWMKPGNAGKDVRFDQAGKSYIDVVEPRLFDLARNADDNVHELMLTPVSAGTMVYGFSFSDACLAPFAP